MAKLAEELKRAALAFGLRDLYVFGSRAPEVAARVRGTPVTSGAQPASDVDVAVQPLPGRELGPRERVRLTLALEDLFGAPRVDLVLLQEASVHLAAQAVAGELLYTSDPHAQAEHELYLLRRAADLAHVLGENARLILEEGAR